MENQSRLYARFYIPVLWEKKKSFSKIGVDKKIILHYALAFFIVLFVT